MSLKDQDWVKCKKCGSYIPAEWQRCGQCGCSVHAARGKGKPIKLVIIVLILIAGYFFKDRILMSIQLISDGIDYVSSQWDNGEGNHAGLQNTEGTIGYEQNTGKSADHKGENRIERSAYDRIHKALLTGENMVMIPPGIEFEQVSAMIEEMTTGDPNILFYTSCTYRSDGLISFKYSKPQEFIKKAGEELSQKADQIISEVITPGMADFEKELAIHNYIVNHCRYDVENDEVDQIPPESHNAYGVLINEQAVCEGYAKAMKLLLDRAGVESLVIVGSSKAQSHAWNLVKIEGEYYHVDATWNDPVTETGEQILQYTYFNLTDEEIGVDHSWEIDRYPSCYSTAYNYFIYHQLVVSSPEELMAFLLNGAKNRKYPIMVKIADYSDKSYNVPELIRAVATKLGSGASYSINDNGIVEVWFGV